MQYMKFYKLYDWILNEFGASGDAVLVSIIYSFEENGVECKLSYSQFAEILKITRPRAVERIQRLIAAGYISVITNSTKTNTYSVNRHSFGDGELTSAENRTSKENEPEQLVPKTELALVPKTELPSAKNGTSTSSENGTQIENRKENIKENVMRDDADAAAHEEFLLYGTGHNVKLTRTQKLRLMYGMKYSKGKNADYYIELCGKLETDGKKVKDHFAKICQWIIQDGGRELDDQEYRHNQSMMLEIKKLMDPYGVQS